MKPEFEEEMKEKIISNLLYKDVEIICEELIGFAQKVDCGGLSKGIIYMVQYPEYQQEWNEYQQEWNENWRKREEIRKGQQDERLTIHKKLHRKYYAEYGISFNPNIYDL